MIENAIRETWQYGKGETATSDSLHILFGVDKNFIMPMGLTMTSILEHNRNVVFHVFIDDHPSAEDEEPLRETITRYGALCRLYLVDTALFAGLPVSTWSCAMYYRLLVEYFYGKLDRLLYLDSDIFCRGSLQELFFLDLQGNTIGAIEDVQPFPRRQREHYASLGLLGDALYACRYFNSGVLLIDIDSWHAQAVTEKAFELLRTETERWTGFPDQDLLNVLLRGHVCWLDARWDTMLPALQGTETDAVLVHYTLEKPYYSWPWYVGIRPGYDEEFKRLFYSSAWKDIVLEPKSATEYRFAAKKHFHAKRYVEGVRWLIRYCMRKILS